MRSFSIKISEDHFVHSLSDYLLGLYLICRSDRLHRVIRDANAIDPLVWKLTSLLHDIGYPVEILSKQIHVLVQGIEEFRHEHLPKRKSLTSRLRLFRKRDSQTTPSVISERYFRNLENLYRGDNAFRIIEDRLSSLGFKVSL